MDDPFAIPPDMLGGGESSLAGGSLGGDTRTGAQKGWSTVKTMGRGAAAAAKGIATFTKELAAAERALRRLEKASGGRGSRSGGPDTTPGITAEMERRSYGASGAYNAAGQQGGYFNNFMGGYTGQAMPGVGGRGVAAGGLASSAMAIGGAVTGVVDSRIDSMYGKSLSYDKLSVLYQQTNNISQQQFTNRFIQPLMKQRLGAGGAATLLGLQAQTGLNANLNASSVSAMQAATGYMYNTQDMSRAMATLGSAQVNNRMTMTMGTGMYGPGGSQRSMMQVIQQVVKSSGLTNGKLAESGMQQGSITRARLSALGLPEDMQNMVLQYAQENVNFKQKGGKGMYDPSKAADRKLMGIEKNFSTQEQETERTREQRDTSFYKRQTDNYAALEKRTQSLTRTMEAFEEKMSGMIGGRMAMKNNKNVGIGKALLGGALMVGGMAVAAGTGGMAAPIGLGMMTAGTGMVTSGLGDLSAGAQSDAMPESSGKASGQRRVNTQMDSSRSFSKLNPKFRSRIEQMLNDNPNVRLGDGHRDSSKQRTLFLSRYSKTQETTGIFWEGSYWKKNPGVPDAAPPGTSMHEVGLAVDLSGDLKWVQAHASKYGLQTFANQGEPWHVQPADLPGDRIAYEKAGARWGLNGAQPLDKRTVVEGMGGSKKTTSSNPSRLGAKGTSTTTPSSSTSSSKVSPGSYASNKRLTIDQITKLLYDTGFRGKDLIKAVAIAGRESIGFNPMAFNGNSATGDLSYGLFQINMRGDLGPSRRKSQGLKKNEDLFDPVTNAKVAFQMYLDNKYNQKRDPFHDWGPYKGFESTFGGAEAYLPKARTAVKKLTESQAPVTKKSTNTGDPMPVHRMSVGDGGSGTFIGGANITIAPNITIGGSGGGVDAHKVAQEAARIIERDLKVALLRSN
jgi:hypothetical protein